MCRTIIYSLSIIVLLTSIVFAGAWGVGSFEKDSAMDWSYGLEKANGVKYLTKTLKTAPKKGYIQADICSEIIAASEVVASLKDGKINDLPDSVASWVKKHKNSYHASLDDIALSSLALCKDTTKSELAQLWLESGSNKQWLESISGIKKRLQK